LKENKMRPAWNRSLALAVFAVSLMISGTAWTQEAKEKSEGEKKIVMKNLPKPVQQTVQAQSKGATVLGISKEIEDGQTFYEAEMKVDGRSKDILIDAKGALVEIEEEVNLNSMPAPLQAEIRKSLGTAKLLKLESITKSEKLTGYEAAVEAAGKRSEISMGPDGKRLAGSK
jgi:hypothetical protein